MASLDGPRFGPKAGGPPRQLVVICHGLGADGHDLIDLAPGWAIPLPHAAFVAPDAPEPYSGAPFGRQWWDVGDREPARMQAGAAAAGEALLAFIAQELARLALPPDSVALAGFSQGAMTVLQAGLRRAAPPRAILAYSGALLNPPPPRESPWPPVLIVHGEADEVVSVGRSRAAESALGALGVAVETLYLPGLGHGIDSAGMSAGALFLQRAFSDGA